MFDADRDAPAVLTPAAWEVIEGALAARFQGPTAGAEGASPRPESKAVGKVA